MPDEPYFCTGQRPFLLNQIHADRSMQSIDVMDPDRLAILGIGAFESIDQVHVVEPALPIVIRLVLQLHLPTHWRLFDSLVCRHDY